MLAALASSPATKALDPDPFPRHSLRHAVYAALLHFGFETAIIMTPLTRSLRDSDLKLPDFIRSSVISLRTRSDGNLNQHAAQMSEAIASGWLRSSE